MDRYILRFCDQYFSEKADNSKEAKEKAAKKLSKLLGMHVSPSDISCRKQLAKT